MALVTLKAAAEAAIEAAYGRAVGQAYDALLMAVAGGESQEQALVRFNRGLAAAGNARALALKAIG